MKAAIAYDQPKLQATRKGVEIHVRGSYLLFEDDVASNPEGPITQYDIAIILAPTYPYQEPKVFEVGNRISRCADNHINFDGSCCLTVWEHWLITTDDNSFVSFLKGPLYEYFISQLWFERTGEWPFGERPHGEAGLVEAYADALDIPNNKKDVTYYLKLLSLDWPKGHWLCPCGSGKRLRYCHRDEIIALHNRIPPKIASRMIKQLEPGG